MYFCCLLDVLIIKQFDSLVYRFSLEYYLLHSFCTLFRVKSCSFFPQVMKPKYAFMCKDMLLLLSIFACIAHLRTFNDATRRIESACSQDGVPAMLPDHIHEKSAGIISFVLSNCINWIQLLYLFPLLVLAIPFWSCLLHVLPSTSKLPWSMPLQLPDG
jgi:hypothetical protein